MWAELLRACRFTALLTVLTGVVYPAVVTGVAHLVFPRQAHGSLVTRGGTTVGSTLIGQTFTRPEYFHPRPSAAGNGYDASASGGSNLGPTSAVLDARVRSAVARYREENGHYAGPIPSDAVTASGSGLDPHISPGNAGIQTGRVARARGATPAAIAALVARHTSGPWLSLVGEPHVNVLELNLDLDRQYPAQKLNSGAGAVLQ